VLRFSNVIYNYTIYFKYCSLQGRVVSCCDIIRIVLLAYYSPHNRAIGTPSAGIYAALTIDTFQSLADLSAASNIDSSSVHTSLISFLRTFSSRTYCNVNEARITHRSLSLSLSLSLQLLRKTKRIGVAHSRSSQQLAHLSSHLPRAYCQFKQNTNHTLIPLDQQTRVRICLAQRTFSTLIFGLGRSRCITLTWKRILPSR